MSHFGEGGFTTDHLYLQFDSASDNKNRFVFAVLAWLLYTKRVNTIEVAMMMVSHTHDDIDSIFAVISEKLQQMGFVGTLDEYLAAIMSAFDSESTTKVEVVDEVFDVDSWCKPFAYASRFVQCRGSIGGVTEARYFKLARRETDGAVVMWYKPSASHQHLYPSKKDALGHPVAETFVSPVDGRTHVPGTPTRAPPTPLN